MDPATNDTKLVNDEETNKPSAAISILEIAATNPQDSSNETTARPGGSAKRTPRWVRIRQALRDPFSEFLGVFTLIMFGDGVVAQVVLSKGQKGDYQSINWGYLTPYSAQCLTLQMGDRSHVGSLRRGNQWSSSQSSSDACELRFPKIPLEEVCPVYVCADVGGVYGCSSDLCELSGCDRCV